MCLNRIREPIRCSGMDPRTWRSNVLMLMFNRRAAVLRDTSIEVSVLVFIKENPNPSHSRYLLLGLAEVPVEPGLNVGFRPNQYSFAKSFGGRESFCSNPVVDCAPRYAGPLNDVG